MPEPVSLSELKSWCRVDHDEDDTLIESLGLAAREYVEQATGRDYSSEEAGDVPERAKTAIKALVAHFYEVREPIVVGASVAQVPMHVRSLLHQLTDWTKLCAEDEEEA